MFVLHIATAGAMRANHKYISREPDGHGGWDYKYAADKEKERVAAGGARNVQEAMERHKAPDAAPPPAPAAGPTALVDKVRGVLQRQVDEWRMGRLHAQVRHEMDQALLAHRDNRRRGEDQHIGRALAVVDKEAAHIKSKVPGIQVEEDDAHGTLSRQLNEGLKHAVRGHLGIARKDMPQLPTGQGIVEKFLYSLQDKGVDVTPDEVAVGTLKATQREISGSWVRGMQERLKHDSAFAKKIKAPIIVSRDGYILDGHHRWATMVSIDPKAKMAIYRVDMPIKALLKQAAAFEGVVSRGFERKVFDKGGLRAVVAPGEPLKKHRYLTRKPTGQAKHPWAYTYARPEGDDGTAQVPSLFHREVRASGEQQGQPQVDLFAGTSAAPTRRALAKVSADDVERAAKAGGFKEGNVYGKRSGFHARPHGHDGHWVSVSWHDYGHEHLDRGDVPREGHEKDQIDKMKAHLHEAGYTLNEAHFGNNANSVLVGRWADQDPPQKSKSNHQLRMDFAKHLQGVVA